MVSGLAAPSAHAGIVDGSLNNATVLSGANILGVLTGSKLTDFSNNNANSKAEGKENNAINN